MKILEYIVFIVGIAIALISAASPEPFRIVFFISIFLSFIGALAIRFTKDKKAKLSLVVESETGQSYKMTPKEIISLINSILADTIENKDLTIETVKKNIEAVQKVAISFVDMKAPLMAHLGITIGAEIYTTFATGERYLSRTWSALVDNHIEEMRNSLNQALHNFLITADTLSKTDLE